MLAWMSLNTTDDNPDFRALGAESILEVGVYITNPTAPFAPRGAVNFVVEPRHELTEVLQFMPDHLQRAYESNGLIDQLRHLKSLPPAGVEEEIIEMMYRYDERGFYILAGKDTAKMKLWLKWHMPDLYSMFGPKEFDLNTIIDFFNMVDPEDESSSDDPLLPDRAIKDAENLYRTFMGYVDLVDLVAPSGD